MLQKLLTNGNQFGEEAGCFVATEPATPNPEDWTTRWRRQKMRKNNNNIMNKH